MQKANGTPLAPPIDHAPRSIENVPTPAARGAAAGTSPAGLTLKGFTLRAYRVFVSGYGIKRILATSRGNALADVWRSDAFNEISFGQFLKIAKCSLDSCQPQAIEIEVSGQPAFYIGHNRANVHFVRPNSSVILSAHPYDVSPEQYRPEAYRSVKDPASCALCNGTNYKDYAGFCMDPCDHSPPQRTETRT